MDRSGGSCRGTGGYADISPGVAVTVKDESGKIVGGSSLIADNLNSSSSACVFSFTVPDVGSAKFYSVEVGRRGALTFSEADLISKGWYVSLSLGS